jgi:threonine dehydrogenase-like Zn-dependent dehydrogenase
MMALKACGVARVYVVDIMEKRLEKALERKNITVFFQGICYTLDIMKKSD